MRRPDLVKSGFATATLFFLSLVALLEIVLPTVIEVQKNPLGESMKIHTFSQGDLGVLCFFLVLCLSIAYFKAWRTALRMKWSWVLVLFVAMNAYYAYYLIRRIEHPVKVIVAVDMDKRAVETIWDDAMRAQLRMIENEAKIARQIELKRLSTEPEPEPKPEKPKRKRIRHDALGRTTP